MKLAASTSPFNHLLKNQLRWVTCDIDTHRSKKLAVALNISEVLASLLLRLGIDTELEAKKFLKPKLADLSDPFDIQNLSQAVDRLIIAIEKQESVLILGDYDVDGITATSLLVSILRQLGLKPAYIVPKRLEEGYGLSQAVIERGLHEYPATLFIALDCGTNAVDEVKYLNEKGLDVLILDHHRSKSALPEKVIIVNPHVFDGPNASWLHLCAVGLVFKLAHGLIKRLRQQSNQKAHELELKDYLDFVSMGTIADLVPLTNENRILVRHGLKRLSLSVHAGVKALFHASGLDVGQEVQPVDVSFKLGPRINASGRLADAKLPLEMLLSTNFELAYAAANELNLLNRQRQEIEKNIAEEAEKIVLDSYIDDPCLVIYNPNWHSGVVGIVAGRLARKFYRPTIVLGAEGPWAKGSGRSIPGINLVDALNQSADILKSWGGHPMAVGVSLNPVYVDQLRAAFNQAIFQQFQGTMPEPTLEIATWLKPNQLDRTLLDQLEQLKPFGEGNPEPVLGLKGAYLKHPVIPFGDNHYRFQIETVGHESMAGVAWNKADDMPPCGAPIDLAVKFGWNVWNGKKIPQVELMSWRLP